MYNYKIDQSIELPILTWGTVRSIAHSQEDRYGTRLKACVLALLLCERVDVAYSKEMGQYLLSIVEGDVWWRPPKEMDLLSYRKAMASDMEGLERVDYRACFERAIEVWDNFQTYSKNAFAYRATQVLAFYLAIEPYLIGIACAKPPIPGGLYASVHTGESIHPEGLVSIGSSELRLAKDGHTLKTMAKIDLYDNFGPMWHGLAKSAMRGW